MPIKGLLKRHLKRHLKRYLIKPHKMSFNKGLFKKDI